MLDGELSELGTLKHRTKESECGLWHFDPACTGRQRGLPVGARKELPAHGDGGEGRARHFSREEMLAESLIFEEGHGVANRVDRLKAIGNGQVPQCAAVAFNILSEGLI